jgi:DMSO/TMAO reductase YedYZ heme-binding membrane subunit
MNFLQTNLGIIIALILFGITLYFYKQIHMRQYRYIAGALTISFLVILLSMLSINLGPVTEIILSGHLALGFFIVVIFAGVFKKNTLPRKALSVVRGEFAVIGFIFLLPHALTRLELALSGYNMSGLFAMITLIPLVITTFMFIRKKMTPKSWKALHKLSYLTYLLIYFHLAFDVTVNPSFFDFRLSPNAILYHVLLIVYIVMRIINVTLPKRKSLAKSTT